MNSLFYSDIEQAELAKTKELLKRYSEKKNLPLFMLKYPKSELKNSESTYEGCFMLMCPAHKIMILTIGNDTDTFEDYHDEVIERINYLFRKYEYIEQLGRFSKWSTNILVDKEVALKTEGNIDALLREQVLLDKRDVKNAELLLTLCTGSVNDIERVKADVPDNILDQVKQKIQSFDADQTRFVFQEDYEEKRVKIQGLSGTGKTELMLHKIKELYQNKADYRIFVTCYNKILADYLRARIPEFFDFMKVNRQIEWEERLWCTHAWGKHFNPNSGLYRYICAFYQIPYYSLAEKSFEDACKKAKEDILKCYRGEPVDPALDYIFVDECQDFPESFFELCELVVSKRLYMAGDIFQSIFADKIERDYKADLFLTRCYRTDPRTLMFAHALGLALFENPPLRWLAKENWEACGYQCEEKPETQQIVLRREPVRRFVDIPSDYKSVVIRKSTEALVVKHICQLIEEIKANNPTVEVSDICIIMLDTDQDTYSIVNRLELVLYDKFGWELNKAYESKKSKIKNQLLVSNKNNAKGLEFPFVICVTKQINRAARYRNTLYTMLTRSFLQTYLLTYAPENNITPEMIHGYEEIMDHSRMTIHVPSEAEQKEIETRFNAEKMKKPMNEIISEMLQDYNLSSEEYKQLFEMATIASRSWIGLSDNEMRSKLEQLRASL